MNDRFVIAPHHPDRLRRPRPDPGDVAEMRHLHAATWNAFRALELLPPAFWLRRLQARLVGEPLTRAAEIVDIHLWYPLSLPPACRIDGGRPDVHADVVIETEHAVWTLLVCPRRCQCVDGAGEWCDPAAPLVRAGGWHAGSRQHFAGFIVSGPYEADRHATLVSRYHRSSASPSLRAGERQDALLTRPGIGVLGWSDIVAILDDAAQADVLAPLERAVARAALVAIGDTRPGQSRVRVSGARQAAGG